MSPEVIAAVIAASISFLTLIGTLAVQFYGFQVTTRNTADTLKQQSIRTLNERFATAADRLGKDEPSAVQMAGVYAMAGLADDWTENRQTCVDILCAFLRMPSEPSPGTDARASEQLAHSSSREIRQTVIRIIAAHLRPDAAISWQRLNFDFTGVVFDGGDFSGAVFADGRVSFDHAVFASGEVDFEDAVFSGATVDFGGAVFSGATVDFGQAAFSAGQVRFGGAEFSGGQVSFGGAQFSGATVLFTGAKFTGAGVAFTSARFPRGTVSFKYANFPGGTVDFSQAWFSGATIDFESARFSLSRITVDFSSPRDWSHPPKFSLAPPNGVRLPNTTTPEPP